MQETVCIVLNEREPPKAKAAAALEAALKSQGITASRVEITEHIEQRLYERRPAILVLDYLLGDFSTGLDVVQRFQDLPGAERPKIFFFTDEPSVPVAVEAMRAGALDYLELDHPHALQRLTKQISALTLESTRGVRTSAPPPPPSLNDLVASSTTSQKLHAEIQKAAAKRVPILILSGAPGSGKRTLAHAFSRLVGTSPWREISLRTSLQSPAEIFRLDGSVLGPRLGAGLSVILLHADEDDGEFREVLTARAQKIWSRGAAENSFLVVCMNDPMPAKAWAALLPAAQLLTVPGLEERGDDIPALSQRFAHEAFVLAGMKPKALESPVLQWLSAQAWPGNIRQLRAAVVDSLLYILGQSKEYSNATIIAQLEEHAALDLAMSAPAAAGPDPISPHMAARVYDNFGKRLRPSAAFLGISAKELSSLLGKT